MNPTEDDQNTILTPILSTPAFEGQENERKLSRGSSQRKRSNSWFQKEEPVELPPDVSAPDITQEQLDAINVSQARKENRLALEVLGGVDGLLRKLATNPQTGLRQDQVEYMRSKFGTNEFPESPMSSFFVLFFEALSDTTLLILIAAAIVSLVIGIWEHGSTGWIEGGAILIAVILVAGVTAGNDYTKELQFRSLEKSSQLDERCSVVRDNAIERINPMDIVVGDVLLLQAGDMIPADAVLVDRNLILSNESALTGEPDDIKKKRDGDCFLLSSCLVTNGEESRAVVIGIGVNSQWGKIKANLVTEAVNTPLQDKLETMASQIGYFGLVVAIGTFIAMVISIWARHHGENILEGFIEAFILAVVIVVVAIPEGLPLAVTIALAYSTKQMYHDQCFIRVLAACETMGNATNICSDKTGTLTENRMTVVEGYFGDVRVSQDDFKGCKLNNRSREIIAENCCVNRNAYLVHKDAEGKDLFKPMIIGSKTEGALIEMALTWGFNYEEVKPRVFNDATDKLFSFNSAKKRSTAIVHKSNNIVRVYCKGAPEWLLKDCTHYLNSEGVPQPITSAKVAEIEQHLLDMSNNALRTLLLAHRDIPKDALPDLDVEVPDNQQLCVDCVVGIIDPLRSDVKEAVRTAQMAGVTVRMVTGDNINTAKAIAKQCGILTSGMALEGPKFRTMTPKEVDEILPKLQVLARSSPEDKFLLVTRLNGYGLPANEEEWQEKHKNQAVTWERDRDLLLPGYLEEWEATRPEGGQVVGVTGDGTNDAPALKAADVGLAMGITGTKVAQSAADIVILDDKFSSIVRAILWGRSVYDNIRRFLQFQLTVNVVALLIVFIGAVGGFTPPLNAVMMLWVNLIMDTMGALALATEKPKQEVLHRKPYKRSATLISRPMIRNILFQSAFQLTLLLILLFGGPQFFNVHSGEWCDKYDVDGSSKNQWAYYTDDKVPSANATISCQTFNEYCPDKDEECYRDTHTSDDGETVKFSDLDDFGSDCLECVKYDYTHGTIIFNTFVFCQLFNEYNAKSISSDWDVFSSMPTNGIFFGVTVVTVGLQIMLVEVGGEFIRTSPLSPELWLITVALALITFPVGVLMRFFPVEEDPESFFDNLSSSPGEDDPKRLNSFVPPPPANPAPRGETKYESL